MLVSAACAARVAEFATVAADTAVAAVVSAVSAAAMATTNQYDQNRGICICSWPGPGSPPSAAREQVSEESADTCRDHIYRGQDKYKNAPERLQNASPEGK